MYQHTRCSHEVQEAKVNFRRLFRQCDVSDCVAQPELGIVRSEMGYCPLPIPNRIRSSTIENALKQRDTILQLDNSASPNYCIYISMFGVNESVYVPNEQSNGIHPLCLSLQMSQCFGEFYPNNSASPSLLPNARK